MGRTRLVVRIERDREVVPNLVFEGFVLVSFNVEARPVLHLVIELRLVHLNHKRLYVGFLKERFESKAKVALAREVARKGNLLQSE